MVTDWKQITLGELGTFAKGCGISKRDSSSGKIPCVRYGELYTTHHNFIKKYVSHISELVATSAVQLRCGDILFAGSGETKEEIGKCATFLDEVRAYAGGDIVIFSPTTEINSLFLGFLLNTPAIVKQKSSKGQGDAVVHISAAALATIEFLCPSPPEQTAIAEALSDADSLIASLQKLIAKKKAIKQGAMQELLTGRTRLPGFSGEWKGIAIGDEQYTRIDYENLTAATQQEYIFQYITLENVDNGRLIKTITCRHATSPSRARRIVHKNDVLFGTVRPNLHSHLIINSECKDIICSTGFCVIGCIHRKLDPSFLYFKLYTSEVDTQVEAIISGSNYPALSSADVKSLTICIPSTFEEQTAIAQILSDMDAEIEQLEKELSKYQEIKQGMLQELLTGRIRLIDEATSEEKQSTAKILSFSSASERQQHAPAKKHNQHFDDAVMIAGIVDAFYSDKYSLGRKKVQKLLYLMRRWEKSDVSAFQKKAAGPYADSIRYKGGEPIATKSKYIFAEKNGKGTRFSRGENITQALGYIQTWEKQQSIDWLITNFQRTKVDDLELFATIDMAACDLRDLNQPVSVHTIKELINSTDEWRAKLAKTYFSDQDIQRAINKCREFFGEH